MYNEINNLLQLLEIDQRRGSSIKELVEINIFNLQNTGERGVNRADVQGIINTTNTLKIRSAPGIDTITLETITQIGG